MTSNYRLYWVFIHYQVLFFGLIYYLWRVWMQSSLWFPKKIFPFCPFKLFTLVEANIQFLIYIIYKGLHWELHDLTAASGQEVPSEPLLLQSSLIWKPQEICWNTIWGPNVNQFKGNKSLKLDEKSILYIYTFQLCVFQNFESFSHFVQNKVDNFLYWLIKMSIFQKIEMFNLRILATWQILLSLFM